MVCIKTHFNLNRKLLLAIGLWPYQKSKFVLFQGILFFGILLSFVIFQLTALITTKCTSDFIIKVFSTTVIFNFYVIKYSMFWINAHNLRYMLEQLQYICNELKDENEIAIIINYGNNAKRYTAIFILVNIFCTVIAISMPIWPHILGILHINESQLEIRKIEIVTEYFVDKKKYFYLILFHTNAVFCIGGITITATGTLLLGYMIHICGLFQIATYRMEQAISTKMFENINIKSQTLIKEKIFYAVEIHRRTMKSIDFMSSSFKGSYLLLAFFGIVSLSLNIFAIFRNATLEKKETFILHLIFVFGTLLYMFIFNYCGEEITNYNDHIYSAVYNSQWYMAPLHVQKMILFILQKSSKTFNCTIAGLLVISMKLFATLTKTSMSYVTVIYSTQQ